jgi:hypothetical protein
MLRLHVVLSFLLGAVVGFTIAFGPEVARRLQAGRLSSQCKGSQHEIVLALQEWAKGHGALPPSLEQLVEDGLIKADALHCPASGRRYIYLFEGVPVRPQDITNPDTCVLACPGFVHEGAKPYFRWQSAAYASISSEDLIGGFEDDPVRLAELLEPVSHGDLLKRLLKAGAGGAPTRSERLESQPYRQGQPKR